MKKSGIIFICFLLMGCSTHKNLCGTKRIRYSELYIEENRYVKFFLDNKYYQIKLPLETEMKNFEMISITKRDNSLVVTTSNGGGNYFYKSIYNFRKECKNFFLVDVKCSTYIHHIDSTYSYVYVPKDTIDLEHIDFIEYTCNK